MTVFVGERSSRSTTFRADANLRRDETVPKMGTPASRSIELLALDKTHVSKARHGAPGFVVG